MKNIILSSKPWNKEMHSHLMQKLPGEWILIDKKEFFTYENLEKISPDYIFIPHWSYIISSEIFTNFTCIVFHMTDLPYGRGGSPLQNLIVRGHSETMISAIKVEAGIDTGPIYLKKKLSLAGTAEEIFLRASNIIGSIIEEIIKNKIQPVKQKGKAVQFKRRTPDESNIRNIKTTEEVYNFIRMLDAENYPKAFIETAFFKFEFSRAALKSDGIIADVKITKKNATVRINKR